MIPSFLILVVTVLLSMVGISLAEAQSTFTPARPPAIPLAVKSPYLSTWLRAGKNGGNGGYLAGSWPVHWTKKIVGWAGLINVDGQVYQWMGAVPGVKNVNQTSFEYTSTKSIFTMLVEDKVTMKITFLSPITPKDMKRMSMVFSYLQVEVSSKDGKAHNVKLYSDISAEWVSGDRANVAAWRRGATEQVVYHEVFRQQQMEFGESDMPSGDGMAEWGSIFYATDVGESVTYQSGADRDVRGKFINNGSLPNTDDKKFRAINDKWPVFGLSKDLGSVESSPVTTLFTIGMTQHNSVQFLGSKGLISLPSLWKSYWKNETESLDFFHHDYPQMDKISTDLDHKVQADSASAAGQNYATITSLTVRQSFGALVFTGNPGDIYVFMKEISSNGNMQTVDVVFPMHPILLYFNPNILGLMLRPLFENQESGHYPNKYAIHDLGSHFPNATGHPDGQDEEMPVEECGNMLIMSVAYAQESGDTKFLEAHYKKLVQWTQFLIDDSLVPANQLSTDDFAGRLQNQTNLALKGIIGIRAMAQASLLLRKYDDSQKYDKIAQDYADRWTKLGVAWTNSPPHTTLHYGYNDTHGLLYNLWCDTELGSDLPIGLETVYEIQSKFYPSKKAAFGMPLDTRHSYTKGDWELFVAATVSQPTRDLILSEFVNWINKTPSSLPLTDLYETDTGDVPKDIEFKARPVMGGVFALLYRQPEGSVAQRLGLPARPKKYSYYANVHQLHG